MALNEQNSKDNQILENMREKLDKTTKDFVELTDKFIKIQEEKIKADDRIRETIFLESNKNLIPNEANNEATAKIKSLEGKIKEMEENRITCVDNDVYKKMI